MIEEPNGTNSFTIGMRKITEDEVLNAKVVIKLHQNGAVSIEGPTNDIDLCLILVETAKDALLASKKNRTKTGLIVPSYDVGVV